MKKILPFLLALVWGVALAQSTISALTAGQPLTGTEAIPMDQSGCAAVATCKTSPLAVSKYIASAGAGLLVGSSSSAAVSSQSTLSTSLSLPLFLQGAYQSVLNSYAPLVLNIANGSSGTPVTAAGPTVAISTYENYASATSPCLNAAANECNASLHVVVVGGSTDFMQGVGIFGGAIGASANSPGYLGGYFQGRMTGGTGIGTGVYIEGGRTVSTAFALGAEVRTSNSGSPANCTVSYTSIGTCDSLWLSTNGSTGNGSSAVQVGTNMSFLEGVTLNNGSVANIGFNDQSSSAAAFEAGGTHTYAFVSGASAGNVGFGTLTPNGPLVVAGGTAATSTSGNNISLGAQNAGSGGSLGGQIFLQSGAGATNGFTEVTTQGSTGDNVLRLTRTSTSVQNVLDFFSNTNVDWQIGYNSGATPSLIIFNSNGGLTPMTFTEAGAITINATAGNLTLSNLSTGTSADTLCLSAAGVVQVQASTCTISSARFKKDINPFTGDALAELDKLEVRSYELKDQESNADHNAGREQIGIIAESVAKVEPKCAIYEDDLKTPKSYRPECITALLVAAAQEHVNDVRRQFELIYALMAALALLALHSGHLHLKVRRLARS